MECSPHRSLSGRRQGACTTIQPESVPATKITCEVRAAYYHSDLAQNRADSHAPLRCRIATSFRWSALLLRCDPLVRLTGHFSSSNCLLFATFDSSTKSPILSVLATKVLGCRGRFQHSKGSGKADNSVALCCLAYRLGAISLDVTRLGASR